MREREAQGHEAGGEGVVGMTQDHIDAFSDALDAEKRGYLICVHHGLGHANSGAHIRTDFDNWPEPGTSGDERAITKEHDVLLAIAAALSDETQKFVVTREAL